MTLAERLAEFAVGLEFDDLPADVVASVRLRALEPDAIVAKFRDNARRALPADRVAAIERTALSLDALDKVARLLTACRV
jgi:hypothetical protein